jgi:hypothetical protein
LVFPENTKHIGLLVFSSIILLSMYPDSIWFVFLL